MAIPLYIKEAIQIHVEETLGQHVAVGAMDAQAAKFLATHPSTMRKWREDQEALEKLDERN